MKNFLTVRSGIICDKAKFIDDVNVQAIAFLKTMMSRETDVAMYKGRKMDVILICAISLSYSNLVSKDVIIEKVLECYKKQKIFASTRVRMFL